MAHLEDNELLPDGQRGFREKRSCLTQLLTYWDTILDQLEESKGVDCVYSDFAKAFATSSSTSVFFTWDSSIAIGPPLNMLLTLSRS